MAKKQVSTLPALIIKDEEKDTRKVYINIGYIKTALMGVNIMLLQGQSDDAKTEIARLQAELDNAGKEE